MTAETEKAALAMMTADAPFGGSLQTMFFDAFAMGYPAPFAYDKNDLLLFASRQVLNFFPIAPDFLQPSTRLRDFLSAVFDTGVRYQRHQTKTAANRDDWISQRIATHWRERYETTEHFTDDRWVRIFKRRLSSGIGFCIMSDVSEVKKREEQWRVDMERVQLTEDILDNLPFPVSSRTRTSSTSQSTGRSATSIRRRLTKCAVARASIYFPPTLPIASMKAIGM